VCSISSTRSSAAAAKSAPARPVSACDGTWRILESIGQRLIDSPDGRPAIIVNSRDITLRKAAEEALQQTEARLRLRNAISIHVKLGMPLDEVVGHAVTQIAAHFPQYRVSYGALDERGSLSVRHGLGTLALPCLVGRTADLTTSAEAFGLLRRGEPFVVEHASRDERLGGLGVVMREWKVCALVLMPLRVGGRLRGGRSPRPTSRRGSARADDVGRGGGLSGARRRGKRSAGRAARAETAQLSETQLRQDRRWKHAWPAIRTI
jgi:PAS domain-containing protein